MILELKVYDCLCATEIFRINGKNADSTDFGSCEDEDRENAEQWCCGDMTFEPYYDAEHINCAKKKYNITSEEYFEICDKLSVLSFGRCGWCI